MSRPPSGGDWRTVAPAENGIVGVPWTPRLLYRQQKRSRKARWESNPHLARPPRCSIRLSYRPTSNGGGGSRTHNIRVMNPVCFPWESNPRHPGYEPGTLPLRHAASGATRHRGTGYAQAVAVRWRLAQMAPSQLPGLLTRRFKDRDARQSPANRCYARGLGTSAFRGLRGSLAISLSFRVYMKYNPFRSKSQGSYVRLSGRGERTHASICLEASSSRACYPVGSLRLATLARASRSGLSSPSPRKRVTLLAAILSRRAAPASSRWLLPDPPYPPIRYGHG